MIDEQRHYPIPYLSTTIRDGYDVPARQAIFTAGMAAACAGTIVLLLLWFGVEISNPIKVLLGVVVGTFFFTGTTVWIVSVMWWSRIIKKSMLRDDNNNGIPDVLEAEPEIVRVDVARDDGRSVNSYYAEDKRKMYQLARGLKQGVPFSQPNWGGKNQLFSQPEFSKLQHDWVDRKLATWRGKRPQDGVDITVEGWHFIDGLLMLGDAPLSPLPPLSNDVLITPPLSTQSVHKQGSYAFEAQTQPLRLRKIK